MITKILFLGPPAAGKTSLRKFFFEGVPGENIIKNPDRPTIGLKFNSYNYLHSLLSKDGKKGEKIPVELSVVDSAGQNLQDWLGSRKERVFPGSDIIFFIFDIKDWLGGNKEKIQNLIMQVYHQRLELAPESSFYIIAHKIDLVPGMNSPGKREKLRKRLKKELSDYVFDKMVKFLDFDIYVTSIEKEYENDTFLTLLNLTTDILSRVN